MNYKTILLIVLCSLPLAVKAQCQQPVLLNDWTAQGGNWVLGSDSTSVLQTVNGGAVYFLSPDDYINVVLSGNFKTTDSDDDVMGFVFGVEGVIGIAPFHCYRFEWDEGDKVNGMYIREMDENGSTFLYSNPGFYWTRGYNHSFTIIYKSSYIEVYVDGNFMVNIVGCFNPGKFGFYNLSQADVTYSNFTSKILADFIVDDSICLGLGTNLRIFCNDNTVHNYTSIKWDMGDGNSVNDSINFSYVYQQPGTYSVKLVVEDEFGCKDSVTKQTIVHPKPIAAFSSNNVCLNEATPFTNSSTLSSGSIIGWQWDFNSDGSIDNTTQSPSYNYSTCGTFNVKLIATSNSGCKDSISQLATVDCLPTANFSMNTVCEGEPTVFIDSALGVISGWSWDFDDGNSSTQQNPIHNYLSCGTFNTKLLVVTNSGCKDSIIKVTTVNCKPVANFSFTNVCLNQAINLNDLSTIANGTITNWSWDLGDGSPINSIQNPIYTYASPGSYAVTLIVTASSGCKDTITQNIEVHPLPIAQFSTGDVCYGVDAQFNYLATIPPNGIIQNIVWDFGDGNLLVNTEDTSHLYTSPGSYTVELLVISDFGCADSISKAVKVNPNPVASFVADDSIGCELLCVSFQDLSIIGTGTIAQWEWDYGDSSILGTIQNPNHCYTNNSSPIFYSVTLTVTSSSGCSNTISKNNYISVNPNPVAQYSSENVCNGSAVQFDYLGTIPANATIQTKIWDFGDGNSVNNIEDTSYLYASAGSYNVELLVVSNSGCSDSITKVVVVNPNPVVNFSASDTLGCEPLCITFENSSTIVTGNYTSLVWSLGDGTTINDISTFNHCYFNDSVYAPNFRNVALTVTSDSGCITTMVKNNCITVYPNSEASFSAQPQITTIADPVISVENISTGATSWSWNFGDLTTSLVSDPLSYTYADTGTYTISLITSTLYNCTDTAYQTITIEPDFLFYIPNAFTPNNDGINDSFSGIGVFIKEYEMRIFDRWGNLIYKTDNIDKPWDGKLSKNGEVAQADVYVYSISVIDNKDKKRSYNGIFTLVR